ncbi:MAG TPA: hypothetical protein VK464_19770 [Symbiobacteriaceae bacterium]|jgi:hypothetical protein|nr:hypothetical protein [Symbiobacteriaceae bacterium]
MEPGDIMLVRGHSPISRLIQWITRSPYSHAALVANESIIIEADWGIRLRAVRNPYRDYDLYTADPTETQRRTIVAYGRGRIGYGYDLWRLLALALRELFHLRLPFLNAGDRLVCSELIDLAYREAGIDLRPDQPDGYVTPRDLALSPTIRKVGQDPSHSPEGPLRSPGVGRSGR